MNNNIIEFIDSNRNDINRLIDLVPIPLFVKDSDGRYVDCNTAFQKFLSFSREGIIGKTVYEIWPKAEADVFFAQDKELFDRGGLQIYEASITSSEGMVHAVQFHKQTFSDSFGVVSGFLGVIFDITEKKRLESALANLAATDELTGLMNRREGMARLEILHRDSKRKNRPYCVAMADLDKFKEINDQYGHANGDLVLQAFAALVKKELRSSDICFRFGGEEFVILLPETKLQDGRRVLERLRESWAGMQLTLLDAQVVRVTLSMGLIQHPASNVEFERLLHVCDGALYEAKNTGRNRIVCVQASEGDWID